MNLPSNILKFELLTREGLLFRQTAPLRSNRVLNGVAEIQENLTSVFFRIDPDQVLIEFSLRHAEEVSVVIKFLFPFLDFVLGESYF